MAHCLSRFLKLFSTSKTNRIVSSGHQQRFYGIVSLSKRRNQMIQRSCNHNHNSRNYISLNRFCTSSPTIINYFKLLNLPQQFDIDLDTLRNNFQQGMKEYHPDKNALKTDVEKRESEKISIQLNTARTILESPLFRAQHLLSLMHPNDASAILDDQYQIQDQHFLFEIMDIRTNIESTTDHQQLQQIMDDNAQTMNDLIMQITAEFNIMSGESISNVRELIAKLTYYHRVEGEIKEKMPSRD